MNVVVDDGSAGVLDYLARAVTVVAEQRDLSTAAGALGATEKVNGRKFLGDNPVPGVYAISVSARERDLSDVNLRVEPAISLAAVAGRLGPFDAEPPRFAHRAATEARFGPAGVVVTAGCDREPGPDALVVEFLLQPR